MMQVLWPTGFVGLEVKSNGLSLGTNFTALDFIGAGVSVLANGSTAEVTIPGGGGGIAGAPNAIPYINPAGTAAVTDAALVAAPVDQFGRPQIRDTRTVGPIGAVYRQGAWTSDGDPTDIPGEGVVIYGPANGLQNAANGMIGRVKADRFQLRRIVGGVDIGSAFRVDPTELQMTNDATVRVAEVRRSDGRAWFGDLRIGSALGPAAIGGVDVQDANGNLVTGATVLELPVGIVGPGAPGVAQILQAPVRVSDPFGNDAVYAQLNFTNMFAGAGAPGVVDIAGLTPPTAGEARFSAYATDGGGDLEYAGTLRFIGAPRTPQFYAAPRFDTSMGNTIFEFEPNFNPVGAGNGFLWVGQDALVGSGTSGGDVGLQAGLSDAGAIGGGAFIQAGGSLGGLPDAGFAELRAAGGATIVQVGGPNQSVSFNGVTPPPPVPVVVGSRGGNAALASLLTQLAATGLIVDSSTP